MSRPTRTSASPSPLQGGGARRWRFPKLSPPASIKASAGGPPHASPAAPRAKAQGKRQSPAYRLEDQVGFILRRAHQRGCSIFTAVMDEFSITPTQFAALAKLHDLGSVSQNELGRLTAMDPATIWGVVSRLIKRGFVSQSMDASDARLVILELTDVGRDAAIAMKDVAAEVSRQTLEPLSEGEQAVFLQLLQRIAANGTTHE